MGIDWAEQFHLVAVGRGENGVFEVTRVQHPPAAAVLVARIVGLEPDPAEVRVVIESSPRGAGGATLDTGFTVGPVNPDRSRGLPAR